MMHIVDCRRAREHTAARSRSFDRIEETMATATRALWRSVTKIRALEVDDVRLRNMSQSQLKGYLGGR
jgi:hypothetical protein